MKRKIYRITGYFITDSIKTMDDLKKQYHKLAKQYHPDAGGSNEVMKLINLEFERLEKLISEGQNLTKDEKEVEAQINEIFRDIINSIIKYPNITIEIVGNWIWVSGNTYPIRNELKEAGFLFASKKKMWFWRPEEYKTKNRQEMSIEEIRANKSLSGIRPLSYKIMILQSLLRRKNRMTGIGRIDNALS